MDQRDFFISHAGEDKDSVARPLAAELASEGWSVWLDELELTIGDSLTVRLNAALGRSQFGVVILSHAFLAKHWPQQELNALAAREASSRAKVILPVWHGIDQPYLAAVAPMLADRLGVSTDRGIEYVAQQIIRARDHAEKASAHTGPGLPLVRSTVSVAHERPRSAWPSSRPWKNRRGAAAVVSLCAGLAEAGIVANLRPNSRRPRTSNRATTKLPYPLKVVTEVRLADTPKWNHEVYARAGDTLEWLLDTTNQADGVLTNVTTSDELPQYLELVPDSVRFTDARGTERLANLPLFAGGYDAGSYNPGDNTVVTFATTVLGDFQGCRIILRNLANATSGQTKDKVTDDSDAVITAPSCDH